MHWEKVGRKLAKHGLNLLGSSIPGASFVTGIVADVLGCVDSPSEIDKALAKANPETIAELKTLQLNHKAKLQEIILGNETARIAEVNKTMREEGKSDKWWQSGWRPFWGFASAFAFVFMCAIIGMLAWRAVTKADSNAMAMIPQMITTLSTLFAIPGAILGISAWHRGKEKITKAKGGL